MGSEKQTNNFIMEKCKPFVVQPVNYYTKNSRQWGNIYEPLTVKLYELVFDTKIGDFGCIQHTKYSFLGASPDGINVDPNSNRYGRMLEIKNIYNRDITGIPKEEYWIQMQIQMETCNLDECDFIESRFKEYENVTDFYEDKIDWKGVILCFVQNIMIDENKPIYEYYPLSWVADESNVNCWIQNNCDKYKETHKLFSTHYWYLDEYSCVLVKRNKKWFEAALPKIEETWKLIEKNRDAIQNNTISNIVNEIPSIHNFYVNMNQNIQLIKLDA